jgi:hypothetical protein
MVRQVAKDQIGNFCTLILVPRHGSDGAVNETQTYHVDIERKNNSQIASALHPILHMPFLYQYE